MLTSLCPSYLLINTVCHLVNMKEPLQFLQIVAGKEQGVGVVSTDPGDVLIQLLLPLQPTLTVSRPFHLDVLVLPRLSGAGLTCNKHTAQAIQSQF